MHGSTTLQGRTWSIPAEHLIPVAPVVKMRKKAYQKNFHIQNPFEQLLKFERILTAAWRDAGVNLRPSVKKVTGNNKTNDIRVIIEKRVILSKDSCT